MPSAGLTIVVPAHNEAERLAQTVAEVEDVAGRTVADHEIIVIDDGSTDGTGAVADELAQRFPRVRVLHFEVNQGVGAGFRAGLRAAAFERITLVPGDNAYTREALVNTFGAADRADMVITYRDNPDERTLLRRILSVGCTLLMRIATGTPIRDAHGLYVWPVANARLVDAPSDYRYHLVTLAGLLRQGLSYVEAPAPLTPRPDASSSVMRVSVVTGLTLAVLRLIAKRLLAGPWFVRAPAYRHRE